MKRKRTGRGWEGRDRSRQRAGGADRGDYPGDEHFDSERFDADDRGGGERGYRGRRGESTPPGAVPGGSYGAGGGYQQGGYGFGGGYAGSSGGGRRAVPPEYPEAGEWRQGYGGYGVGEGAGWDPERGWGRAGEYGAGRGRSGYGEARGASGHGEPGGSYGGYGEARGGAYGGEAWGRPAPGGWRAPGEGRWFGPPGAGRGYRGGHQHEEDMRGAMPGGNVAWTYVESWAVPGPHTGRGPEGYRRSGESIRDEVCERLTRHGALDASGIRVSVEDDEVVLEGTVEDRRAKRMAEDAAESVYGVHDVHNRLRVRARERSGAEEHETGS